MRDSPNGKRYGRRDPKGNIVEASGFDLSPIAARHAEFVRLAEAAREERELMGRLRRRATIARKGIAQILEAAAEYGSQGEEWSQLARDTQGLAMALKRPESPRSHGPRRREPGRRQDAARERLEGLLKAINSDPLGAENGPPIYLQSNS